MMTMTMSFWEVHTAPEYPYGIHRCMPERKEGKKERRKRPCQFRCMPARGPSVRCSGLCAVGMMDGWVRSHSSPHLPPMHAMLRAKRDKKQSTTQKDPSTVDG